MEILAERLDAIRATQRYCKVGCAVTLLAVDGETVRVHMVEHRSKDLDGVTQGQWGPVSETVQYGQNGKSEDTVTTTLRALREEVNPEGTPTLWIPRVGVPEFDWPMGPGRLSTFALAQFITTDTPDVFSGIRVSEEIEQATWVDLGALPDYLRERPIRSGVQEWHRAIRGELPAVLDAIAAGDGYAVIIPEGFPPAEDIRFKPTQPVAR